MEITPDELDQLDDPLIVDVRSPNEFAEDHLPAAINLPVLDNDERDHIGTIYHQESTFKARREGAKTICENVPGIIDALDEKLLPEDPLLLYCWRGGQRSQSLAIILDRIGYNVHRLEGGYKAYRNHVHEFLKNHRWNRPLVTIFGLTGAGKTNILAELDRQGASVLDLEDAANHRGSAFGGIGLEEQPSQKLFERRLYQQLKEAPAPIFTEGESRKIGRRTIPDALFEDLVAPPKIWLETPLETRVKNICEEYPWPGCREQLIEGIGNLTERLGKDFVMDLQDTLERNKLDVVVRRLLEEYYDPAYKQSSPDPDSFELTIHGEDLEAATEALCDEFNHERAHAK